MYVLTFIFQERAEARAAITRGRFVNSGRKVGGRGGADRRKLFGQKVLFF